MARNRRNRIDIRYVIVGIIAIIIIIIAILSYTLNKDKKLNRFEALAKDTIVGIQRIVYYPFNGISNLISEYNDLRNVRKENEKLKDKIEKVNSLEAENAELQREIDRLKGELNIDYVLSDYTYLNATVISRNTGYWYNTLTVDKGTKNGVEVGMVVINSTGLIGKIVLD